MQYLKHTSMINLIGIFLHICLKNIYKNKKPLTFNEKQHCVCKFELLKNKSKLHFTYKHNYVHTALLHIKGFFSLHDHQAKFSVIKHRFSIINVFYPGFYNQDCSSKLACDIQTIIKIFKC